jgi:cell division protein FtsL
MSDFLEKLKKSAEGSYSTVLNNAVNLKDLAEGYGKIAKLKFELHQLKSAREKKLALLGKTVFPYLLENNTKALQTHETLQMLLDEIKNLGNQVELVQHAISDISDREKVYTEKDHGKIQGEIEILERQIEEQLEELKAVKKALDK